MKANRVMGWLRQVGAGAPSREDLAAALRRQGVSREAIEKASRRRLALDTRLVSALVEQGDLEEPQGLEALSRSVGLPGVCLRRSVIELANNPLPEALAREWVVLPVATDANGCAAVACTDHLREEVIQEMEILLGRPVRLHVALQYYLRRAILAAYQLKRECPSAAFLLGDHVESTEGAPQPTGRAPVVVPETAVPALCMPSSGSAVHGRRALVGFLDEAPRQTIGRRLRDLGFETTLVADGPAALRCVAAVPPQLVILDARLPHRSAVDVFRRVHGGERHHRCVKVLVVPPHLGTALPGIAGIHRLSVLSAEGAELESAIEAIASGIAEGAPADDDLGRRTRAAHYRGLALRAEGDLDGAARELTSALRLDPLYAETLRELADLHYERGQSFDALEAYAMVADLGAARADDVARLAELVQRHGELNRASRLWEEAARLTGDAACATQLRAHAAALARGAGGEDAPADRGTR